jgi:hypothetical protein
MPLAALCCLVAAPPAYAVVVRDDVPDAKYRVAESEFPALVDLPGEGQGVLIDKRWVVTAAHATQGYTLDQVRIAGQWRKVARLVLHPQVNLPSKDALALKGDAAPLMAALAAMHDVALIELAEPVEDVSPVQLYRKQDEAGKVAEIYGRGATGNGKVGEYPNTPHRGELRRAYNWVTAAHDQWLDYRFDCGADALPLEGVLGDGDSGGPLLIQDGGVWKLAGLADWKHWSGDLAKFRPGICGQDFSNSRISYYAAWIDQVIAGE